MPGPSYSTADDGEGRGGDAKARREAVKEVDSRFSIQGGDTAWSRRSRLTAVCLVVLCVLLLIVVIVLSNNSNNLKTENEQLQTSNKNLTIVSEQLQGEREQLQGERAELQRILKLGWTYFNSSFYSITTEQKSWIESRRDCKEKGADLVIINSREEQEFIHNLRGGGKRAWIGLSDRDREGEWKWVDNTTLITGFWASGQPDSYEGNEDCVIAGDKPDSVNNWGDANCNKQYIWICKKTFFN